MMAARNEWVRDIYIAVSECMASQAYLGCMSAGNATGLWRNGAETHQIIFGCFNELFVLSLDHIIGGSIDRRMIGGLRNQNIQLKVENSTRRKQNHII